MDSKKVKHLIIKTLKNASYESCRKNTLSMRRGLAICWARTHIDSWSWTIGNAKGYY